MALDVRVAQTTLENLLRDTILFALGARLPAVSTIAALRALTTQGSSGGQFGDDSLVCVTGGAAVLAFRWSSVSTAADNGMSIIQPADVAANGRWLAWTSLIRFSPVVGGNAMTLDQVALGPVARVILLDKNLGVDEAIELVGGQTPAVIIQSDGDTPEDATLDVGHRWETVYDFTIHVVVENLRDRREAAQGSEVPADPDPGANSIDGFIQVLLSGTVLNAAFVNDQPIQNTKKGHANNWVSDFAERRIIRSRAYALKVSEEFPAAPNDTGAATEVDAQANLTDLHQQPAYDPSDYLVSGIAPVLAGPLTQTLSAGAAVIAGVAVTYAGGSVTFTAYRDTYRDLLPNGTITLVAVPASGQAPPVTAGALRIGFTTTNSSMVVGDTLIAQTQAPFGPVNVIPL